MKKILYFGAMVVAVMTLLVVAFMGACVSQQEYDRTGTAASHLPRSAAARDEAEGGYTQFRHHVQPGDPVGVDYSSRSDPDGVQFAFADRDGDGQLSKEELLRIRSYPDAPGFDLSGVLGGVDGAKPGEPNPPRGRNIIDGKNVAAKPDLHRAGSANEELWVIERPRARTPRQPDDDAPGCGWLMTRPPGESRDVPVPLAHTDVRASITGYISSVEVTQNFHNPYSSKIEAVYVFPLPENAGVNEFVMKVGERTIRGIVREREEAQKIYTQAKAAGYVASLMTQERPNIFTQKVANIEPGHAIDISIKYFHTLSCSDGWYEFVFPMVVGPRFNPPGSAEGVGAVARGERGASGQRTEVQYLAPGERTARDISLSVDIEAGMAIEEVKCESHRVDVERPSRAAARVKLSATDSLPNKDFVLSYRLAGDAVKTAMLTSKDQRGGYFTMMLVPPSGLEKLTRAPLEVVFVVDRSGSMDGRPIEQAREAVIRGLRYLRPDDTFQVINFSEDTSQFGPHPVVANYSNIERAIRYVEGMDARGGTMMLKGLRAALTFSHDPRRVRVVAFLTDGFIGNEAEILGALHKDLGDSRIFSFGVGSSTNRYLLAEMAKMGRGAAAFVLAEDNAPDVMELFMDRISHPALADVSIDWGSAKVSDVYPKEIPDLFVGRPVIITGRYEGDFVDVPRVKGKAAGVVFSTPVPMDEGRTGGGAGAPRGALAAVWARMKIAELGERMTWDRDRDLRGEMKQVALDYGLMSQFTSFIAVDTMTRTGGQFGTTVAVPVPVPEGVRYETAVPEQGGWRPEMSRR